MTQFDDMYSPRVGMKPRRGWCDDPKPHPIAMAGVMEPPVATAKPQLGTLVRYAVTNPSRVLHRYASRILWSHLGDLNSRPTVYGRWGLLGEWADEGVGRPRCVCVGWIRLPHLADRALFRAAEGDVYRIQISFTVLRRNSLAQHAPGVTLGQADE